MIKKMSLEGFTGLGEAKQEVFGKEYLQNPLKNKNNKNKKTYFAQNSTPKA